MPDFYVYMLQCSDGSYYVGHTDDMDARLYQHENKMFPKCYTAKRLPVKLVFVEGCSTREEVFTAEWQIKGWSRKKKEALIKNDYDLISLLSKKKFTKKIIG